METLLSIGLGIGLSAACGFRVSVRKSLETGPARYYYDWVIEGPGSRFGASVVLGTRNEKEER